MKKLIFTVTAVSLLLVLAVPALAAAWASPEEMVSAKSEILEQRVEEGVITQEEADELLEVIQERAETCDGVPDENRERLGLGLGLGDGNGRKGARMGAGNGFCNGTGYGQGRGRNR